MKPIRVLVVDDSSIMRQLILDLLAEDSCIQVVAEAADGMEALHLAAEFKPDLITMDLEMPHLGGMEAIEILMSTRAVPILVLSDQVSAQAAMKAVAMGALEVLDKSPDVLSQNLCRRVRLLAGVPVVRHIRTGLEADHRVEDPHLDRVPQDQGVSGAIFGIASSTGGPQALEALLRALPAGFPAPILIAQHMAEGFSQGLVDWLNSLSPLDIQLARHGQYPEPGQVLIAPSEFHLAIEASGHLTLLTPDAGDIYHPSCDCLLSSLAKVAGRKGIGIILTGMGRDGVQGIKDIKGAGGTTLAQDEASSVIFGMNRLAIETGKVDQVLSLTEIAKEMQWLAATR
jgi:two-component system chemotaxis response regulator CheB